MPQVLIRDLDSSTLKKLKKRSANRHRSLQGELHAIVTAAVEQPDAIDESGNALKVESARASYVVATTRAGKAKSAADRDPGRGAKRRNAAAPTGSVWNWLKQPSRGKLSKDEIDAYIRAERDSWGAN